MQQIIWAFWNSSQRRLRAGWRVFLQFFITIIAFIAFVIAVTLVFQPDQNNPVFMMFGGIAQNVIFTVMIVLACVFLDRRRVKDLGLDLNKRWWIDLFGGWLLGGVLMGVIFLAQYQQGMITLGESTFDWNKILLFQFGWLVTMIFVGTGEEILSRGYQLKNITEGFQRFGMLQSFLIASMITSGIFGVLHMLNPNASVIAILGIVMAGAMFCVGRIFTGSLAAPIGMHISWNYFQGAVFGFPVSGNRMDGSLITIDSTTDSIWTGGEFGPENSIMGLIAIVIAMIVFVCWPKKKTGFKENLVQMIRYRSRAKVKRSPAMAKVTEPQE